MREDDPEGPIDRRGSDEAYLPDEKSAASSILYLHIERGV